MSSSSASVESKVAASGIEAAKGTASAIVEARKIRKTYLRGKEELTVLQDPISPFGKVPSKR